MKGKNAKILLVEDSPSLAVVYEEYLLEQGYGVQHVATGEAALQAIDADLPEAILLDLQLPDMNGMEILREVRGRALPTPVIVITAHGSVDIAVEVMQEGAVDFIEKPFGADRLLVTLENALKRQNLEEVVDLYRRDHFHGFVGGSLAMQSVYQIISSAAASKARYSSPARAAPARRCAPAPYTTRARGAASPSSRSTARPFRET